MNIEAMKLGLEALDCLIYDKPYAGRFADALIGLRTAIQQAEDQQPATGEPVYWEWRHLSTHPATVDFGQWSEWQRVEARNPIFTAEDALAEFRAYIAQGYKYELRALYTTPQPAQATPAEAQQPATGEPVAIGYINEMDELVKYPAPCIWMGRDCPRAKADRATHECYQRIYTHPAPSVPEGYALVPIEPTQAMMNVQTWDFSSFYSPREIWAAMLAAK